MTKLDAVSDCSFGKDKRLLNKAQFDRVFANPIRIGIGPFLLLVRKSNKHQARLGLVISKKRVRLACERNRIKRHFRESFRQADLNGFDVVAISGKGLDGLASALLRDKLRQAWNKIKIKCSG